MASVATVPLQGVLGETFSYTNTGYVMLGMIIEQVSGQSYEAFLQEYILDPLGMNDTGYEHGDTPGLATGYQYGSAPATPFDTSVPYAAGGLYSTVGDLHRWDEALYTDTLASASAIERFFTPLVTGIDGSTTGYAYGVFIGEEGGAPLIAHPGSINGFATYLARYPDEHINVVLLSNRESASNLNTLAWGRSARPEGPLSIGQSHRSQRANSSNAATAIASTRQCITRDIMMSINRTTISLDENTQRRLRQIAASRGISMAAVIREAIDQTVELHAPKPASLGVGASGTRDTGRVAGEVRPEPRAWR